MLRSAQLGNDRFGWSTLRLEVGIPLGGFPIKLGMTVGVGPSLLLSSHLDQARLSSAEPPRNDGEVGLLLQLGIGVPAWLGLMTGGFPVGAGNDKKGRELTGVRRFSF